METIFAKNSGPRCRSMRKRGPLFTISIPFIF
jgi:hypothetical protein